MNELDTAMERLDLAARNHEPSHARRSPETLRKINFLQSTIDDLLMELELEEMLESLS